MAVELRLASETLTAQVAARGGELVRLTHRDHGDLLWSGDPAWWPERSPILFPVVGRCAGDRIRVGGGSWPMPLHGFARSSPFEVVASASDGCLLRLADSPATRDHYPFAFALDLAYRLEADSLRVEATVRNPGAAPLPASFGFHPGIRWPLAPGLAKEAHSLAFEADTHLDVSRARAGLLLPQVTRMELDGGVLPLSERLFDDGAMVLRAPRSRRVRMTAAGAPFAVDVATRNLPALGLWMKPGAGFLCIEPWAGHGDPEGFGGDIFDKPGIVAIPPGGAAVFAMQISIAPGLATA